MFFAEMQFGLKVHLLNVVVWMALTSHAAEESFCTEGCPSYSIAGIVLPIDGITHNISVWQKEDSHINFGSWEKRTSRRMWFNITTIPQDSEVCFVSPLLEPGYCATPVEFVYIASHGENNLWRIDCNGDSCGCQHHRLIALRIGRDLVSKVFWWPPQNISKVVIAPILDLSQKVTTFEVPSPPKWHDFAIGGSSTGYNYQLMSSSLTVKYGSFGQKVWIYGINDKGEKIPSYFAMGCVVEPTEYPGEKTVQGIMIGLFLAVGALLLILLSAVVLIRRFRTRKSQITNVALEAHHNEAPLEDRPPDLIDRLSRDDQEYSYIDTEALRIQLERERAEGFGPRDLVRDSVDRRSADNHEYCYIDAEALRTQLEKEKRERLEGQNGRKISTKSHESRNSLYEELTAVER